ncbi:MAG: hypothetical protein ACXV39_08425 [Halobacteriota archaeon]
MPYTCSGSGCLSYYTRLLPHPLTHVPCYWEWTKGEKRERYFITYLNVYVAPTPHETILDAEHPRYCCYSTLQRRVHEPDHPERIHQPDDRRDHDSRHDRFADTGGGTTDRGGGVRLRLPTRLE